MSHLLPSEERLFPQPGHAEPAIWPQASGLSYSATCAQLHWTQLSIPPLGMPSLPPLCLFTSIHVHSLPLPCSLPGLAGNSLLSLISPQPFGHVYFLAGSVTSTCHMLPFLQKPVADCRLPHLLSSTAAEFEVDPEDLSSQLPLQYGLAT